MLNNTADEIVDQNIEQILNALRNKDKNSLKKIFSRKALKESEMIDEAIDNLFIFFQGDIVSWERYGGLIVNSKFDHGDRVKEVISFFYIDTNKQKYLAFILLYTEDTAHPENIGLYALRIIKAEDKETQFGFWQDMNIPGVYNPEVLTN